MFSSFFGKTPTAKGDNFDSVCLLFVFVCSDVRCANQIDCTANESSLKIYYVHVYDVYFATNYNYRLNRPIISLTFLFQSNREKMTEHCAKPVVTLNVNVENSRMKKKKL